MKLLNYIHTILLIIGFGLLSYGLFSISAVVGFTITGILLILFAFYLDRSGGHR